MLGDDARFEVGEVLGRGTFGKVFDCFDRKRRRRVAVKVVRRVPRYLEAARIEADILFRLGDVADENGEDASHCVRLLKHFSHHGHECLAFERLGPSLLDFLKSNQYRPFETRTLRRVAAQLLEALAFLHDACHLVHTDLKLENVLFTSSEVVKLAVPESAARCGVVPADMAPSPVTTTATTTLEYLRPASAAIKLIDFGGATVGTGGLKQGVINTRQYRSPEVVLELGWSFPSDVWGLGCILMELFTGDLLFPTHDEWEHLALMERVVGRFPPNLIRACAKRDAYFSASSGMVRWPAASTREFNVEHVRRADALSRVVSSKSANCVEDDPSAFTDLVSRMLVLDPAVRSTARELRRSSSFVSPTDML